MKSRVGLAFSIGLNLGLAGALVWLWKQPRNLATPGPTPAVVLGGEWEKGTNLMLGSPASLPWSTNQVTRFTWRSVESPDYRKYVANLRAIFCPEETIRDIIVADVNKLYAARWRNLLEEDSKQFRYWQTGDGLPGFPTAILNQQAESLDSERRALLKELLDLNVTDSIADLAPVDPIELTLSFLPADRREQVIAAQSRFAREQSAVIAEYSGTEELSVRLENLRNAYQMELGTLMTPEERRRFEMTTSPLAMALRMELEGFEPTEEEFRQIYEARKLQEARVEAAQAEVALKATLELAELKAAEETHQRELDLHSQLLAELGPQRYAELQHTTDPQYQTLMRVSRINEVPAIVANRIYELQQIARLESEKVRANTSFTLEQKEAALAGIQAETTRTIRENFSPAVLRVYQQWNGQ